MDDIGYHGGTRDVVMHVPFYHFHGAAGQDPVAEEDACQLSVAPTILSLMGLDPHPGMHGTPLA